MNEIDIMPAVRKDFEEITDVWEASVRATHDFLDEKDIVYFRSLILSDYLHSVRDLFCVRDEEHNIIAFIGVADKNIEMLFIHPDARGNGIGKALVRFAIGKFGINSVDVNEQNAQAVGFYLKMGFKVAGRDELDGSGKPYPILHMQLNIPQKNMRDIEQHPLGYLLPENAKVLMLGSFPPKKERWSMDFYYPNFQNDMWRIMGVIFFNDKDYFIDESGKAFSKEKAKAFCLNKGLAIGDTAVEVIRLKGNASDKHLEVITPIDLDSILTGIPGCKVIIITGEKAMKTLQGVVPFVKLKTGDYADVSFEGHNLRIYRMPSTSRAYRRPVNFKAEYYRKPFEYLEMV